MEMKCSLLQTADKKLWLLVRKASCAGGTSLQSGGSNQTTSVDDKDEEVIAHPAVELWHHCLLRGANLGSFLSIVCGTPFLLYKGVRQPVPLLRRLAGISTYGVVLNMYMIVHLGILVLNKHLNCNACMCTCECYTNAFLGLGTCYTYQCRVNDPRSATMKLRTRLCNDRTITANASDSER